MQLSSTVLMKMGGRFKGVDRATVSVEDEKTEGVDEVKQYLGTQVGRGVI